MAVIWKKKQNNKLYEVRSAGSTRRLYTNRVCHSQYNPNQILTGSVWDLLLLPAFFHSEGLIKRVLVLGVGGGAILRQVQHFFSPEVIVGVEMDAMHLEIGQRFLNLKGDSYRLEQGDAVQWVENYKDEPFDLIIEDLFTESSGQPVRAVAANSNWFKQLLPLLDDDGVLVMNFASKFEFRNSALFRNKGTNHYFRSIFQLTMPTLENYIAACVRHEAESAELHRNLNQVDVLRRALESKKLRYRIRKLRKL